MEKSADAFRTISEVADDLILPQHVLRFWETRFPQIRPLKRAGGRRYYRPDDVVLLKTIRQLLYDDGYTIKGVQRLLKEQGVKGLAVKGLAVKGLAVKAPLDFVVVAESDDELNAIELKPEEPERPAEREQREEPTAGFLPPAHASGHRARRRTLLDAIATLDECVRILEATRRPE